jgi:putative DNA primase/helicase
VHLIANGSFRQGERNNGVFRHSCRLRGKGLIFEEAQSLILKMASECIPALPEEEALACLESAWKYSSDFKMNDTGNSQRLVSFYGEDIKYTPHSGQWYLLDSGCWAPDTKKKIVELAKESVALISTEIVNTDDANQQQNLRSHQRRSGSRQAIDNMIALSKSDPRIAVSLHEINANPLLLGTPEGVLNIDSGSIVETADFITKRIPTAFDPHATCPRWNQFLHEITGGNPNFISFVQRAVGYSLTGLTQEQCLFFLHGSGANGKSVFLNVISTLFGDYAEMAPSTLLSPKGNPDHVAIAGIHGARLVVASEVEENSKFSEALIKQLSGGDPVTARSNYKDYFTYTPQYKIWIMGNHRPLIRGTDNGIWRRLKLIPFEVTFPPNKQDKDLEGKLKGESPGILNWALKGYKDWREQGLNEPEIVTMATHEYRSDMDVIGSWIEQECVAIPEEAILGTLYHNYEKWADESGECTVTRNSFGRKLKERGYMSRKSNGKVLLKGLGIKNANAENASFLK